MLKTILFRYSMILIAFLVYARMAKAEITDFYNLDSNGKLIASEPDFNKEMSAVAARVDAFKVADVKVKIIIQPKGDGAAFDYGSVVYIPRSLVFYGHYGDEYQKYVSDLIPVFAHEYGHAIFGKLLEKEFVDYVKLKSIKEEISVIGLKLLTDELTAEQIAELQKSAKEKEQSILKNPILLKIANQEAPYNELYADAVAVFVEDNRSAIYNALAYDKMPFYVAKNIEARDFYLKHDPETWSDTDSHTMFSPLRSVIGSEACWPKTLAERQLKLKQLKTILIDHIKSKVATGQMPAPTDNKDLIREFVKTCK